MEDLSGQINENLSKQGEKIRGSTEKVREVKGVLESGSRLIDRMLNRENRRANAVKIVLVLIVMIIGTLKLCCY